MARKFNITDLSECYLTDGCKKFDEDKCNGSFCIRLYKLNFLYEYSMIPKNLRTPIKLRLDANRIDEAAYTTLNEHLSKISEFVNTGNNLYIYSQITGNGKTSWAIKLLQAYLNKIWTGSELTCKVLFINVPKYLRELKINITEHSDYIAHINHFVKDADIVVWDDIATKSSSEYETEQLMAIIDDRINASKSNIFTSNILPEELTDFIGPRLTSRIVGSSEAVQFLGSDKRGVSE